MDSENREATPNPYAPPMTDALAESDAPSFETLESLGPITYAGSPNEQDLYDFLAVHGHVGCGYMCALGFVLCFVILTLALMVGTPLFAVGGIGLTSIVMIVSTTTYRRLVFESINPRWSQETQGVLSASGLSIERQHTSAFFRWDWYGGAIVCDRAVVLLPATQPAHPLFISREMLHRLDDWDRLLEVAGAIGIATDQSLVDSDLAEKNLRLLRRRNRVRSIEPPTDAIVFEGELNAEDLERVSRRFRWRERPLRFYLVMSGLLFFGALVVIPIAGALVREMSFLPGLVAAYAAMAVVGLGIRRFWRGGRRNTPIYYLDAFATEESLVTDFVITSTQIDWSGLCLLSQTDDCVVLRRREWVQFIFARRDMFSSEGQWRRFNSLVEQHCANSAGSIFGSSAK